MTTLYIREVPEAVAAALRERAAARGTSLSGYLVPELTRLAERPVNEEIADTLRGRDRSNGPTTGEILAAVEAGRR